MKFSLNELYRSLNISKQNVHQYLDRQQRIHSEEKNLLLVVHQLREDHPTMGCRDMYFKIKPSCFGRDAFERFCKAEHLIVDRPKNYQRTTDSSGVIRFDNLMINTEINRPNQVWQSDITYFEVGDRFYYITFIIDAYTRRIVGHSTAKRLYTEDTTLTALKMALKTRGGQEFNGLIFHSDGGGQYYAKDFLRLTKDLGIKNSMCEYPWENGKAERINGVIKNNYLKHRKINNYDELVKEVDRSVSLYNYEKPHIKLQRKSPIQFEKEYICNGQNADGEISTEEYNSALKGKMTLHAGVLDKMPQIQKSQKNITK